MSEQYINVYGPLAPTPDESFKYQSVDDALECLDLILSRTDHAFAQECWIRILSPNIRPGRENYSVFIRTITELISRHIIEALGKCLRALNIQLCIRQKFFDGCDSRENLGQSMITKRLHSILYGELLDRTAIFALHNQGTNVVGH